MILLTFLLMTLGSLQEKTKYVLEVPEGDVVVFEFPKDWKIEKIQPRPTLPPTLRVTPPNSSAMSLQITMLPDKDGRLGTLEELKKTLVRSTRPFVSGSVEKKLTISSWNRNR